MIRAGRNETCGGKSLPVRENALVTVGRKAEGYFRFRDYPIDAGFAGFSDSPTYEDARRIGRRSSVVSVGRTSTGCSSVYTRFISAGRQEVVVEAPAARSRRGHGRGNSTIGRADGRLRVRADPETILETLLPRYTETRVYAALLNAAASEHASRQHAMKAATDNAEELILTYRRRMNRARQDSITTEIMEIVGGGAEALSQGAGDAHVDAHDAEYYDKTA